jgi:hypothetical protein
VSSALAALDVSHLEAEYLLEGLPTINIEGLVPVYAGRAAAPTYVHRAEAKIDMRPVKADKTAVDTLAKLKAHPPSRVWGYRCPAWRWLSDPTTN